MLPLFVLTDLYAHLVRSKFNRLFPRKTEHDRGRHDDALKALYELGGEKKQSYAYLAAIPEYRKYRESRPRGRNSSADKY